MLVEAAGGRHRLGLDVHDLEAVVHAGREQSLRIARMPLQPPDAAADVERAERTSELARVEEAQLGVVAADSELVLGVPTAGDRRDAAIKAVPSA